MARGRETVYDAFSKVLYISFGPPEPSVSEEIGDCVLLNRSQATNRITGITVIDFELE